MKSLPNLNRINLDDIISRIDSEKNLELNWEYISQAVNNINVLKDKGYDIKQYQTLLDNKITKIIYSFNLSNIAKQ